MNSERIRRLADFLDFELPETSFNMSTWWTSNPDNADDEILEFQTFSLRKARDIVEYQAFCGTEACIAGWANALFGIDSRFCRGDDFDYEASHIDIAADLLGLDKAQSAAAFLPAGAYDRKRCNRRTAVAMLRNLADTGVVDWDAAAKSTA